MKKIRPWYPWPDSNRHALRLRILNPLRLPFRHTGPGTGLRLSRIVSGRKGEIVPVAAAAAVVVHRGHVLLARRRNPPDAGLWGYPGGHREPGESAPSTATRELHEETGVVAVPIRVLSVLDLGRFRLAMVACRFAGGHPRAADDVDQVAWISLRTLLAGRLETSRDVDTMLRLGRLSRAAPPPCCGTSPTWQ